MSLRLLAAALLAVAACATKPAPSQAPAGQPAADPKAPVARIGGDTVTFGDLDDLMKKDLRRLESEYQERVYEAKKAGLDQLIVKRLVEAKAKAASISPEEFVKREVLDKIPEPPEAEVRAVYERAKASGQQMPPLEKIRDQVSGFVRRQKAQEAVRAFYEKLKTDAKVEILLPPYRPPRVAVAATGPAKGPSGAKVTIVEFSDFQCPFCSRAESTVAQVMTEYKDKVRVVFRDYPLPFHAQAQKAAEASHCAEDQGKYWEMHGKLFANQNALEVPALKSHAHDLGLDQAKFDKCLDSGEKAPVVEANRKAGDDVGVSGTPAFFVNGLMISGAQPFETFKSLIDAELAQK